jgi:ataxia telangiectasia mutated family protein
MRNPDQILAECFDPAVRALDRNSSAAERAQVFHSFAAFADAQFEELQGQALEKRERFEKYKIRKDIEFSEMDQHLTSGSMSSDKLQRSRTEARQHIEEDLRTLEEMERTTQSMLVKAVENYAKALAASHEHDDKVFRLVGLWLANSDKTDVHEKLKPLLKTIPSHKFVFLAFQLSARLSRPSSSSNEAVSASNIRSLVSRLCIEHPYHAIYPVHALRDPALGKASRRSSTTRGDLSGSKDGRGQVAAEIIDKIKEKDHLQETVEAIELALEAYAEWAEFDIRKNKDYIQSGNGAIRKGPLPVQASQKIRRKVINLPIPVTTIDLPVDISGRYDGSSFPTIVKYKETFETAGGINLPKIMTCLGSDGKEYKQLVRLLFPFLLFRLRLTLSPLAAQGRGRHSSRRRHGAALHPRQRSPQTR